MEQASFLFWAICAVLVLLTLSAILLPLLRNRPEADSRDDTDIDIYKSQLAEVDRDLARGVLAEDEAQRTRTEIARRLLAADKDSRASAHDAPSGASRVLAGLLGALVLGLGAFLYLDLGAPGQPDQPRAARIAQGDEMRRTRMSQLEAEAQVEQKIAAPVQVTEDVIAMIDQLRTVVPTRPDDIQGWTLLANNEARLHNYAAAAEAQAQVNRLKGTDLSEADKYVRIVYEFFAADAQVSPDLQALINDLAPNREMQGEMWQAIALDARRVGYFSAATRAQERYIATRGEEVETQDYHDLLDYMVSAANGFVSPEAETIAIRLLQQDRQDVVALYYAGLLYAQTNRPDRAFAFLRQVVETANPDSLHYLLASRQIEDVAWFAGVDYTLPDANTRGPSAADMAAAEDMSDEDRTAMIQNMVSNLSERLASEGGSPEEWAQLIRALGVLGETDRATAIWTEAQQVFAASDEAIATIGAAARAAGVE